MLDQDNEKYQNDIIHKIYNDERFKSLVAKKQRFSLLLLLLTLGFYIVLIVMVAFAPDIVGKPVAHGKIITLGIPIGLFLIIWTIMVTGYYVYKTNTYYDPLTQKILKEITNEEE